MPRTKGYRTYLAELEDDAWDAYLAQRSGLPGPRANLELAEAVADVADAERLRSYAADDDEFFALCGAVGLGRLAAEGDAAALEELKALAGDSRWRVREGVAMGLQRIGDARFDRLVAISGELAGGDALAARAAVGGLCEPRLLRGGRAADAFDLLDAVTARVAGEELPRDEGLTALVKALGYGWSVAVAADPEAGKPRMERWFASGQPDVRRAMRENLRKKRLEKLEPEWVARWRGELA